MACATTPRRLAEHGRGPGPSPILGENRTFPAGSERLFWANAIDFRDHADDFYEKNRKKLLILLALLEGCEDYDGMKAVVRKLVATGIVRYDKMGEWGQPP